MTSVLLIGCGRLGSALVNGWLDHGGVAPRDLTIAIRSLSPAADRAAAAGARLVLSGSSARAEVVVLAVKPKAWREAVAGLAGGAPGALVSLMAGVRAADLATALPGWRIVRVMPTTGVAAGRGVASWWSEAQDVEAIVTGLFTPIATVVPLAAEVEIDVATAVSGSGQGFILAFAQALADAAETAGLDAATATKLARATLASAAAVSSDDRSLEALIAEVASPGGTTEAGLRALARRDLSGCVSDAVQAARARARELAQTQAP